MRSLQAMLGLAKVQNLSESSRKQSPKRSEQGKNGRSKTHEIRRNLYTSGITDSKIRCQITTNLTPFTGGEDLKQQVERQTSKRQNCCSHCQTNFTACCFCQWITSSNIARPSTSFFWPPSYGWHKMGDQGLQRHEHTGTGTLSMEMDVPKFLCLPSATLVSWNPWLESWLMRRVSSWQARLFPGTKK